MQVWMEMWAREVSTRAAYPGVIFSLSLIQGRSTTSCKRDWKTHRPSWLLETSAIVVICSISESTPAGYKSIRKSLCSGAVPKPSQNFLKNWLKILKGKETLTVHFGNVFCDWSELNWLVLYYRNAWLFIWCSSSSSDLLIITYCVIYG